MSHILISRALATYHKKIESKKFQWQFNFSTSQAIPKIPKLLITTKKSWITVCMTIVSVCLCGRVWCLFLTLLIWSLPHLTADTDTLSAALHFSLPSCLSVCPQLYLALAVTVLSSGCSAILFSPASFLHSPVLELCSNGIYASCLVCDYRRYYPSCTIFSRSTNWT